MPHERRVVRPDGAFRVGMLGATMARRRPRLSIAAIAEGLGYATPLAFARQFTHQQGMSPRRFRAAMAG